MEPRFVFTLLVACFITDTCQGNTCYFQKTLYKWGSTKVGWWGRKSVRRVYYSQGSRCCTGYTGPSCRTPICNPPCIGGTCVSPNRCQCDNAHTGSTCQTVVCSHLKPCFPGVCTYPHNCRCQSGFTGTTCLTLQASQTPHLLRTSTYLVNQERTSGKVFARFLSDSTAPNTSYTDTIWLMKHDFNIINIYFESMYNHPLLEENGNYIENSSFGIVDGRARLTLTKIQHQGSSTSYSHQKNYTCPHNPNTAKPQEGVFKCNITDTDFDWLLENGDIMVATVSTQSGGFRALRFLDTHYRNDLYKTQTATKHMQFMFDYHPPYHCLETKTCSRQQQPLLISNDISKGPVTISWDGWNDTLSGVHIYTVQVYPLKPDRTGDLTEVNPSSPIYYLTNLTITSNLTYLPPSSGMYSVLLEVGDKANNTKYSRRTLLFDNESNVTMTANPITVEGAVGNTNSSWIDNLDELVVVNWHGHFENKIHEDFHLLNAVATFKPQTIMHFRHKNVSSVLDDHEGKRTLKKIANKNGITKVQITHNLKGHGGLRPWTNAAGFLTEKATLNISRLDGDTIQISVKAFDVMGNSATQSIFMNVDSTSPHVEKPTLNSNVKNGTFPFSSGVQFLAYDGQSGITMFKWKIKPNDSDEIFHEGQSEGNITGNRPSKQEGECSSAGGCFYYLHQFEINNCWLMVPKDKLETQVIDIHIDVFNLAMLNSSVSLQINHLPLFDGIEEYYGPTDLIVSGTTSSSVNFQWHLGPSCYVRTDILLMYNVSGQTREMHVQKDSEYYTLGNLDPETAYTAHFVVEYGDEKSDPVHITFTTGEREGLSVGIIAAISVVIVILVSLLIAGIVLWRTGRLSRYKESIYGHIQRRTIKHRRSNSYSDSKNVNQVKERKSFANLAYSDVGDDDVYLYGQMVFNEDQAWEVHHDQISLVEKMNIGRFADIFKASQNSKKNNRKILVAKVLKESHTEIDEMVMTAKINFFATKIGSHPNVIKFAGAVLDNKPLGPFMLLELCEAGVMRTWLQNQRTKITDSVVDTLYRMTFDIARGMDYLASKKIIHRHLAARNILLTSSLEAKVAGFGPTKETEQQDGDNGKGKVAIKWMAPECMTSVKDATMPSDVWSYGIVMWEIFSLGETPYPGIRSMEVATKVSNGYRMSRPEYCADMHYDLMKKCWNRKLSSRPTFSAIVQEISNTFSSSPDDYYYTT
ncbi:uncharacterized protein LOC110456866 [Mizuhopecten yessoensis]|uniref:Fibroblast growth factor receptor 2 n=1 Tax=Mizuhopecten yessoensis TaxID=6573 RepID=A0A210R3L3_MIZYE|nr:uncharacterized protein LOC110456866 [Mizuhopecten yessoensis]OWF55670.1 Fibroblast growth factor receptor 2 [Mizuhopecten yessoensis]